MKGEEIVLSVYWEGNASEFQTSRYSVIVFHIPETR